MPIAFVGGIIADSANVVQKLIPHMFNQIIMVWLVCLSASFGCLIWFWFSLCSFGMISSMVAVSLSHQYFRGIDHPLLDSFEAVIRILEIIYYVGWS